MTTTTVETTTQKSTGYEQRLAKALDAPTDGEGIEDWKAAVTEAVGLLRQENAILRRRDSALSRRIKELSASSAGGLVMETESLRSVNFRQAKQLRALQKAIEKRDRRMQLLYARLAIEGAGLIHTGVKMGGLNKIELTDADKPDPNEGGARRNGPLAGPKGVLPG